MFIKTFAPVNGFSQSDRYTSGGGLFEMFGADTLGNLERKLLISELAPNNRTLRVCDGEVRRVLALHPDQATWPPIVRQRAETLDNIKGQTRGPKQRIRLELTIACTRLVYKTYIQVFETLSVRELAAWCVDHGIVVDPLTRGDTAAEFVRVLFVPHISRPALRNLLSAHAKAHEIIMNDLRP